MAKIMTPVPCDVRELLEGAAARYGTKTAIRSCVDGVWQDVSYNRFAKEAKLLAASLSGRFAPTQRVLIIGKNSYRLALSYMALTYLGAVPVPVGTAVSGKQMAEIASQSEAVGVLYAPEMKAKRRHFAGLRCICFDKYPVLLALGHELLLREDVSLPALDASAEATLLFTPGTAGTVKGVRLSHQNLLATVHHVSSVMKLDKEDAFLSVLPLSHAFELTCGFLLPLYHGATVAFSDGLEHLLRDMRRVHPTCMVVIPYLAEVLYRKCWASIERAGNEVRVRRNIAISDPVRPLSARQALKERLLATERDYFGGLLRRLIVLGGPMDVNVQKGLRQLGVFAMQGYGMTECAGLVTLNRDDCYRDGTAGLRLPCGVLDIYNAQPDGSGEIRYKGENVMLGYLNDPQRTATVPDGEWLYTGDVGKLDADGFLYVLGRRQNCIETAAGYLISPEALERLLCQSPFIKEAAVVGYFNAERRDIEVVAMVVPERTDGALSDAEVESAVDEWIAEINGELPLYQQITHHALCDKPLFRDAAGELRRGALQREFASYMNEQ